MTPVVDTWVQRWGAVSFMSSGGDAERLDIRQSLHATLHILIDMTLLPGSSGQECFDQIASVACGECHDLQFVHSSKERSAPPLLGGGRMLLFSYDVWKGGVCELKSGLKEVTRKALA